VIFSEDAGALPFELLEDCGVEHAEAIVSKTVAQSTLVITRLDFIT
jgi:hypothetical protein